MSLRVTFDLGDSDLKHFRLIMKEARQAAVDLTPDEILQAARGLLELGRELPEVAHQEPDRDYFACQPHEVPLGSRISNTGRPA